MKDKDKQIEEMANEICGFCMERRLVCFWKERPCEEVKEDAERLYNAGYRKVDKDSVVLSKEAWRKYVDNENEAYYRGQHEAEVYYKNIQIPRERKETAEKILFKFESAFAYYDNEDMFSKKAIFECFEEIIKQVVDTKEN